MKVLIKHFFYPTFGDDKDRVEVFVGDELVGSGYYGGEPEDNSRSRDYSWVESLVEKLALKLGAEVECSSTKEEM